MGQQVTQWAQRQPDVVGIEVAVAADVLEGLHIVTGALGTFAQHQASIAGLGQVAPFAVGVGTGGDFHQKGNLVASNIAEDTQIGGGTEVVDIGRKEVFVAIGDELVEGAATPQHAVEFAMAGGAPFEGGVVGPGHGLQVVGAHLGDAALEQVVAGDIGVVGQQGAGIGVGGEAIHKQQRQGNAGLAHQLAVLFGDDIEEGVAVTHQQQRFGLLEAHARAQAAIQAQHDGASEGLLAGRQVVVEVGELGQIGDGGDGGFGHHAGGTTGQLGIGIMKGGNRGRVEVVGLHFGHKIGNRHTGNTPNRALLCSIAWRDTPLKPRVISLRPFRAIEYPGRCPGRAQLAPSGLNYNNL